MDVRELSDEEAKIVLARDENHFCDLKRREIAPAKLSRSISAFANTAGGELFIGIAEADTGGEKKREWIGFADVEAANAIVQVVETLAPLQSFYSAQMLSCPGCDGLVLHLVVLKTRAVVCGTDGTAYIRRGAQNLPVSTPDGLRRLELDKGLSSFEDETINIPLEAITNSVTALEFLLEQVPTAEPEVWLKSQFLMDSGRPTVAGVLLFADEPQAALPKRSAIKIFRYGTVEEGVNRETLAFTPMTTEGPIYDLIEKAVSSTKDMVDGVKKLGEQGLEEISYPHETLHEIITNAVLHRDYSHPTDIQIRIYDDRIEVESPGRLPGHITIENILDEQFARNPKLVRLINKFPDPPNKDVGEGLNTAFAAMERIRLKKPEIVENENSVTVFIRHTRLSSPAQIVMEYLGEHEIITNEIGRQITGIRRDIQMKDLFVALRKRGQIERVPGTRGRASAWRKVPPQGGTSEMGKIS